MGNYADLPKKQTGKTKEITVFFRPFPANLRIYIVHFDNVFLFFAIMLVRYET